MYCLFFLSKILLFLFHDEKTFQIFLTRLKIVRTDLTTPHKLSEMRNLHELTTQERLISVSSQHQQRFSVPRLGQFCATAIKPASEIVEHSERSRNKSFFRLPPEKMRTKTSGGSWLARRTLSHSKLARRPIARIPRSPMLSAKEMLNSSSFSAS